MEKLICTACSNGCFVLVEQKDKETALVSGNKCSKGFGFAYNSCKEHISAKFVATEGFDYDKDFTAQILDAWGLKLTKLLPSFFIQGSPNRSICRTVVEVDSGERYVLEEIEEAEEKEAMANTLQYLKLLKVGLNPYLRTKYDTFIYEYDSKAWRLSKYLYGQELDRSSYWQDAWRGDALADYLLDLYEKTSELPMAKPVFSMIDYIEELFSNIKEHKKDIVNDLEPVVHFLRDNFYDSYRELPLAFSHGDPHPMNMVWGKDKIIAAIDWEFSGPKPSLYDSALIIGCVGSEAAEARNGQLINAFKNKIKDFFTDELMAVLPIFVIATRFAWLSEWLRTDDKEMIEFEIYYMNLLIEELA